MLEIAQEAMAMATGPSRDLNTRPLRTPPRSSPNRSQHAPGRCLCRHNEASRPLSQSLLITPARTAMGLARQRVATAGEALCCEALSQTSSAAARGAGACRFSHGLVFLPAVAKAA
jgi:hypothetical protein